MHAPRKRNAANTVALGVELDHTLIRADIVWHSLKQLWRRPLLAAFCLHRLTLTVALRREATTATQTITR